MRTPSVPTRARARSIFPVLIYALFAASTVAAQPGATPPTGTTPPKPTTTPPKPTTTPPTTTPTPTPGATTPGTTTPGATTPGSTTPGSTTPGSGSGAPLPGTPAPTPGAGSGSGDPTLATAADGTQIDPEQMPVNLRLRRLEQRVQALKERAWRAKARTTQLKEAVLGGGVGAQATLVHVNRMGSSFRLQRLVYALDGTQIFARSDEGNQNLYKTKSFDVLTGPISPGSHTISVLAIYKGHGYGVFKYLTKYTFTVRSSHTFTASEGKATRIEAIGFERGGPTTPLDKRPAIDFKVTAGTGAKEK
jgi:hypothetical protein